MTQAVAVESASLRGKMDPMVMVSKIDWEGAVLSVQPRIRLTRSFDQRSHSYLGYVLCLQGTMGGVEREFAVAVGPAAHEKHQFRVGDRVAGTGDLVLDPRLETADLYKASGLKVLARAGEHPSERPGEHPRESGDSGDSVKTPPPFLGIPPALEVYRERGHRRLAAVTYSGKCSACLWGCEMAVEMIIDHWNPGVRRYRRETFCYGPKSCPSYKAGPARKVPGRKGMSWLEEDWVEEEETAHRGEDE